MKTIASLIFATLMIGLNSASAASPDELNFLLIEGKLNQAARYEDQEMKRATFVECAQQLLVIVSEKGANAERATAALKFIEEEIG